MTQEGNHEGGTEPTVSEIRKSRSAYEFAGMLREKAETASRGRIAMPGFTDDFIRTNTIFGSGDEMLRNCGRESIQDFLANPPEQDFFLSYTSMANFDAFVLAAKKAAAKKWLTG